MELLGKSILGLFLRWLTFFSFPVHLWTVSGLLLKESECGANVTRKLFKSRSLFKMLYTLCIWILDFRVENPGGTGREKNRSHLFHWRAAIRKNKVIHRLCLNNYKVQGTYGLKMMRERILLQVRWGWPAKRAGCKCPCTGIPQYNHYRV